MDITLRDYQLNAIESLRDGIRSGIKNQVLASPTGSGKTVIGAYLVDECLKKGKKAIFIADRIALIDQTSKTFDQYGIPHGILQAQHWRYRPYENIQIASAQTLARRKFPKADLIIVDECFVGGTQISTPSGNKSIDNMRFGDLVYTQHGIGSVENVSIKPCNEIYKLELDDGTIIECTGEHPIFTEKGWVKARNLDKGSYFFTIEAMRLLWQRIQTLDEICGWEVDFSIPREVMENANLLLSIVCQEIEEPNEQSSITTEDEGKTERNKAQTYKAWRQRAITSFSTISTSSCFGGGLGSRVFCGNKKGSLKWGLSESLQDRHCEQRDDDWSGAGWRESWLNNEKRARQKENRFISFPRLVNISNSKPQSVRAVYNLHIKGHPSYFANGIAVHNCHSQMKVVLNQIAKRECITIGLSATPFTKGLGKYYDAVKSVTTTNNLIANGFLANFEVYAASEPDMSKAKVVAGEWTDNEAAERSMPIVGDCVREYLKHGNNKKFIAFACNVAHCEALRDQFLSAGINVDLYTYKQGDEHREELVTEFRKTNSMVRGLISVSALAKGFDVPDVEVIIMARPLRSSLSEHIQILGRGLRAHPDKTHCTILDHSGNMKRFWDEMHQFLEHGVDTLCDGKPKEKKEKKEAKKEPRKCPSCHHLHNPAPACPMCGFTYKIKSEIRHEAGELTKLGKQRSSTLYEELAYYALVTRKKDPVQAQKWCQAIHKSLTGVWATKKLTDINPVVPTMETVNKIKHTQIKWSKSRRIK